jgi:two-component system sensor histidine kinase NreB
MKESLKVLMLEDSLADAEIIQRLLLRAKLNCEFRLATNEASYLLALDEFSPAVILSDHSLPQFNSVQAFKIVRQRFPDIPFIMVTGAVSEEFAAEMVKIGVDDYILKDRMVRLPDAIITTIQRRKAAKEKLEADQKIIQSETNLRTIFENTSEGFLLLDNDAVVVAFNKKATDYAIFNHAKQFQINHSVYEFIEESRMSLFQEIIGKARNGKSIRYESSSEFGKASTTWIDFNVTPIIETGQVKGICITGCDITEKKIIEQEREFDRNNLKALINNTHDLMWSVDRDHKLLTSNEAFNKMVKAMSGKTVAKGTDILANGFKKDQSTRFRKYYERAFSGESFTEIERSDFHGDFWAEISFYPIYSEDSIIGAACFSRDITQRKIAEKEISDYKNAIDQSSIVSITDQKGIIKYVNDNFCKISGYSTVELLGQDHRIINSGYHPSNYIKNLWTTIAEGKIWRGEFCNKAKDASLYWVDGTITPFLNAKGKPVQYLSIRNDITEKKTMEQKIIDQNIQEQKKISRAILKAQERERNHLGRELHDNVNQILAATKMLLFLTISEPENIGDLVADSIKNIENALKENRKIAQGLVLPDFETILLSGQLSNLTDHMLKQSGIDVFVDTVLLQEELLEDEQKLAIYRIAQEQCTNIVKYAGAGLVNLSASTANGLFKMIIADDGRGMEKHKNKDGIGLRNIRDRLNIFNGKVNVCTFPGKGFSLEIIIPTNK